MAIELNNLGDCTTDLKGTGIRACDLASFGDAKGLTLLKKGITKPITDGTVDFDLASYTLDVKKLNVFPLIGIYDFGQDTPENEVNTSSTGVMTEIRAGKPQFSFMFDKGGCFHKALYDKKGKSRWDVGIVFEAGILMATNAKGDKLKGFDAGMLSVDTFKLIQGTDPQMSTAKVQFLDAEEFNERFVFIPFTLSGDIDSVDGVVETAIKLTAATGTSIEASITSGCNTGDSILDLDELTNFVLLGTQASATTISSVSYNANTNKYVFTLDTPLVASDTVQIQLNDGTYKVVEDTVGNLYKGTSNLVTVA